MIKMKNILAENLLRFGVKNLNEADKSRLNEQAYTVIPLTISLPYKKLSTGEQAYDDLGAVKVLAKNATGTEGTSLEDFSKILTLTFGSFNTVVNSKKDAAGNIVGTFSVANDPKFKSYLKSMIGKTTPPSDKSLVAVLADAKNPSVKTAFFTAGTVFNTYDTGTKPYRP